MTSSYSKSPERKNIFAVRYINHAWYLLGDTTLEAEGLKKLSENSVQSLQGRSLSLPKELVPLIFLALKRYVILL